MPDIILSRVQSNGPSEDNYVKPSFVKKLIYEGRPLERPYIYLYPYHFKPPLNNGGGLHPEGISHICEDGEFKRLSVFIQQAVSVSIRPPGLAQQSLCLINIIFIFFYVRVIWPCIRDIRPCCRLAKPEQDAVYELILIYGMRDCLTHPLILKPGVFKIKTHVCVCEYGV